MTLVLRTSMPLSSIETAIRAIVRSLDPGVPVFGVATLEQQMKDSRAVFRRRFPLLLSGVFAATALLLTLVALYAVSIHEVVTRERELGVRVALGASPAALRGLIAGDALRLTSVGIAIGLILAILTTRSLQALVFEVSTRDVRVYSAAALTMAVSALAASIRPILRAGRVDPSVAMRSE
jgi:ABC-type antimicrobial peptide transport system permease subunit